MSGSGENCKISDKMRSEKTREVKKQEMEEWICWKLEGRHRNLLCQIRMGRRFRWLTTGERK